MRARHHICSRPAPDASLAACASWCLSSAAWYEPSNETFDRELRRRDSRCGLRCLDAVIRVEEFADVETLRAVGLDDPWNMTGLYQGHPLSEQSIWSSGGLPPIISLFRSPLLNEWIRTGVALEDLVSHVTVCEVGHHFGLSDDQMQAIENDRF